MTVMPFPDLGAQDLRVHGEESPWAESALLPLVRLLTLWFKDAGDDFAALKSWLTSDLPIAAPLLTGIVHNLNWYRRALWVRHLAAPEMNWFDLDINELHCPRLRVNVPAATGNAPLRLRRESPFDVQETLAFLNDLADFDEAAKLPAMEAEQARGVTTDILYQAIRPLAADEVLLGPLEELHRQHRGEQCRAQAQQMLAASDEPPPPSLRKCLRQLLAPDAVMEGCVTPAHASRLFLHAPRLLTPWLGHEVFESARAVVEALRAAIHEEGAATLGQIAVRLDELREFAHRLLPLYAGPAAGPHRDWARHLLENFEALGTILGYAREMPDSVIELNRSESPSRIEAIAEAPTPGPPEDDLLTTLAHEAPAIEQFLGLKQEIEELRKNALADWQDLDDALRGLHYAGARFRQRVARASATNGEERQRQFQDAARQLADEFMSKIRRLDSLLTGQESVPFSKGAASLGEAERDAMGSKVKAVRDRVFRIMHLHGGYEEYPVAVGEPIRKHAQALEEVTYVSDPRRRPEEIVRILEPGYVRRRDDGETELIHPPRVVVAR